MSKSVTSEIAASAVLIEGTISQIEAICKHQKKWYAELWFNGKIIPLDKRHVKKIDSTHYLLHFPLNQADTVFKKNFGEISKDLTFYVKSLKANEVLSPLTTNGMKVRIAISNNQEFTLSKNSINFINSNKLTE